jgi:hypothetical protein
MLQEILETVRGLARSASPAQAAANVGDIINALAETKGTATHNLFRRLEKAQRQVHAKEALEKIERVTQAKIEERESE